MRAASHVLATGRKDVSGLHSDGETGRNHSAGLLELLPPPDDYGGYRRGWIGLTVRLDPLGRFPLPNALANAGARFAEGWEWLIYLG